MGEVLFLLLPLVFGSVGALVATRRPDNPIGWLLCGGSLSQACYSFAAGYAWTGLVVDPGQLVGAQLAGWLTNWLWVPIVLAIALTLQLFPDGRLLGPRWRLVAWITVSGFVILGAAARWCPAP
jgi:hypothetical protein